MPVLKISQLDSEGLSKLKEDDLFEAGCLLPGLDRNEPICWKVLERLENQVTLHAYYFDVFLFKAKVTWNHVMQKPLWSFS